eukprot:2834743-Alexandrium_andersonii.AAC.1
MGGAPCSRVLRGRSPGSSGPSCPMVNSAICQARTGVVKCSGRSIACAFTPSPIATCGHLRHRLFYLVHRTAQKCK